MEEFSSDRTVFQYTEEITDVALVRVVETTI